MRGERALAFVSDQVWAVLPSKLEQIVALIEANLVGPQITEETIQRYAAAQEQRPSTRSSGAVAVLPIYGLLTHRMNLMSAFSGGTSTQALSRMFRDLMANENVMAVVLEFATPGGSVWGLEEFAREVAASKGKPVIAMVNAQCASGGMWIASQCDQIVCTPSGEVGSVGAIGVHTDLSKMAEMEGVKKTFIVSSGSPYKAEGNEFNPLIGEALAHVQSRIDAYGDAIVRDVARGRGITAQAVRDGYGQGRMFGAQAALKMGMIDGIMTMDEVVARLAAGRKRVVGTSAEEGGRTVVGARMEGGRAIITVSSVDPGVTAQIINAEGVRPPVDDTPPPVPEAVTPVAATTPAKAEDDYEPIAPDEDGNCPDGHEKGEDGMCYPVEEVKGEATAPADAPPAPAVDAGDLDRRRRRLRLAGVSRR